MALEGVASSIATDIRCGVSTQQLVGAAMRAAPAAADRYRARVGGRTLERSGRFVKAGQLDRLSSAAHRSARNRVDICHGIFQVAHVVERRVKLFKNGRNQAVRIPREFELRGEDAIIRKEGQRLIIEPAPPKSLLAILATLQTLDEEFPPIDDSPAEPVDL
jgi:antitoxin VapB